MGRYNTSGKGETVLLVGELPTGGTVTITIYDLSDGSSVALTSNTCSEIGVTGLYRWDSSNITTQPTTFKQYLYVMSDGTNRFVGKFVLGGFADEIEEVKTKTDNLPSDPADQSAVELAIITAHTTTNDKVDAVQIDVTAIKGKTDNLPTDPTSETNATANKNAIIVEVDANETKIDSKPTLVQIEASTVLAKEATLILKASQASVDAVQASINTLNDLSLADIEGSTILAKEATLVIINDAVTLIRKINEGRWKIVSNQLIIYDDDGVTPLKTFNLSGEQTTAYSERTPT